MVFLKLLVFSRASCVCKVQKPTRSQQRPRSAVDNTGTAFTLQGWPVVAEAGREGELQDVPGTERTGSASPQGGEQEMKHRLSDMLDSKAHWYCPSTSHLVGPQFFQKRSQLVTAAWLSLPDSPAA